MLSRLLCSAAAAGLILLAANPREERGRDLFLRRCSGCHDLDLNKEGPRLRGVFGRKAAAASGFTYSDAVKKLDLRWDEATLDRWLSDPDAMAPKTDMEFRLAASEEREAVIAYLKGLDPK
jgi:cytochrome c